MKGKYGRLAEFGVDENFFDAEYFAEECDRIVSEDMEFHEDALEFAFERESTTEEERQFIMGMLRRVETSNDLRMGYVSSFDITRFSSPSKSYYLDFKPMRKTIAELFAGYLDGSIKGTGKKTKKTELARFGHLEYSASQNLSKVLNLNSNRDGTFEFMSICCLYFKIEPIYATILFHQCRGVDELQSYPYIGGALWLFLEDECYDYELFVKTSCQALKSVDEPLPDGVAKSRYWNEIYKQTE